METVRARPKSKRHGNAAGSEDSLLGKSARLFLFLAVWAAASVSCSKSTEAISRQKQEEMFRQLVGFAPSKDVAQISYKDVYARFVMNGGWERWMSFTYSEGVFSKILKDQGYKKLDQGHTVDLASEAAPKWWPKVDQGKTTIYVRGHEDTKESEGYSFRTYIWHDTNSNVVYLHKQYWN